MNDDPLVAEQLQYRRADVSVFAAGQLLPLLDDGHPRAEAAHGLRQFQPDIAAAQDDQVLGQPVQVQQFDVGHRPGRGQAGDLRHGRGVPRSRNTRSPRMRRLPPSASLTSTVRSPVKRASPMMSSAPLAR